MAGEIEKQSDAWGQLLLKLQQKNAGDIKEALSESVLAVQLMQSRLMKLSASAAVDCAGVKVAIASACSMMMKVGRDCIVLSADDDEFVRGRDCSADVKQYNCCFNPLALSQPKP